jgi:O-antigen/teichoic acid export membrane protein
MVEPDREDGMRRAGLLTWISGGVTLALNLVAGIIIARALGTTGRGELAVILTLPQLLGWMFAVGSGHALAFNQARDRRQGGALIGTWLVLLVPLGAAALLTGELLVPAVFAAQSAEAADLAQVFMVTTLAVLLSETMYGILLGDEDFVAYNAVRLAQPLIVAVAYAGLEIAGVLSVETAVAGAGAAAGVGAVAALARAVQRNGVRRPDLGLARRTLWYGIRAHSHDVAGILNARLDLLIIPAFLSATKVGLYSVASNVSWIVVTLASAIAPIVVPIATRSADAAAVVIRSLHATLALAFAISAPLALAADFAVPLVYGEAFEGSAEPLRILLPGAVLYAGATVLASGLYAQDRPLTAGIAQTAGIVVTAVGLTIFLSGGGIIAAAWVSTASYACVFVLSAWLYARSAGIAWRTFLRPPSRTRRRTPLRGP